MSLEQLIMADMKDAMKAKNEGLLRGLRAIKAEIIKAKTEPGANGEISAEGELKLLQKLIKQRKSFQERANSSKSRAIDRALSKDHTDDLNRFKILLLGTSESGKSTIFRQMR